MINNEWDIINLISNHIKQKEITPSAALKLSIGDDCAIYSPTSDKLSLHSTDISIENIHFKLNKNNPTNIGYKAMIGNISDIIAMGGKPKLALIALGLPQDTSENFIIDLYNGFLEATNKTNCNIVGGDISKSPILTISISIFGEVSQNKPITRDGAKTGDNIYITGDIGRSKAGLELHLSQNTEKTSTTDKIIEKHLRPDSCFDIIEKIHLIYSPTSMIDISDGLISDLNHISEKSNCGYEINLEKLPVHENLKSFYGENLDFESILSSGEEYELLFTSNAIDLEDRITINNKKITKIGTITEANKTILKNKIKQIIKPTGYNHFEKHN